MVASCPVTPSAPIGRVYVLALDRLLDRLGTDTPLAQVSPRMLAEFMTATYPTWRRPPTTGWSPPSPRCSPTPPARAGPDLAGWRPGTPPPPVGPGHARPRPRHPRGRAARLPWRRPPAAGEGVV